MYAIIFFCLLLIPTFSAAIEPLTITIDQRDTTNTDTIVLSVTVLDANGEGVVGLDSSNFQVFLSEKRKMLPKQVINFYQSEKGVAVMVCIDASLTMQGKPLEDSKIAVKEYLDNLRSQDRVAILSFHSKVELVSDFSMNRQYLKKKIDGIVAGGTNTELYYALDEALDHLNQTPNIPERKLVIVISDGRDEGTGAYNLEQCVQKANRFNVPIYSVGFTKIDEKYLRNLEAISERTKGRYYRAKESSVIREGFNKSLEVLKSQYGLRIFPPKEVRDGRPRMYSIVVLKPNFQGQTTFQHTLPAGTEFGEDKEQPSTSVPLYVWLIGAGVVILLGVAVVFILQSQRKAREREAERIRKEEEAKRQAEEAQRREEELRRQLSEKENASPPSVSSYPPQTPLASAQGSPATKAETPFQPAPPASSKTMVGSSIGTNYTSGQLLVTAGVQKGQIFTITRAETTLGRGVHNTIVLQDQTVSTNHAIIRFANGQFQYTDNQSTNGTYINGQRVQFAILRDGDLLRLGQTELQFKGK
ncbi:MAG: VWA domain-containing protein [bacterium]|nr:VWA domain-containing protein [bacterium]